MLTQEQKYYIQSITKIIVDDDEDMTYAPPKNWVSLDGKVKVETIGTATYVIVKGTKRMFKTPGDALKYYSKYLLEDISFLLPHHIFVFGSNKQGIHGAGAALTATKLFGAKIGAGEGLTGNCYALPTMDVVNKNFQAISLDEISKNAKKFYKFAEENKDKVFLLTKVGCGLGGYDESDIKLFFKKDLPNLVKPINW